MRRGLVLLALGSFVLVSVCGSAAASGGTTTTSATTASKTSTGSNWVGVTQTLVVSTTTTGKVSGRAHVYTQVSAAGSTPTTLKVPMSSSGLRNLRGFGTPPVIDGQAVWHLNLNEEAASESTVADFPTGQLPLQVSATYKLNGKTMSAKDILGKSGELSVHYDVKNVSTAPTTVTFKNVLGKKETRTVSAPVPFAALFLVTFPSSFTKIHTPGGVIYASPTGSAAISAEWILLLFEPLGSRHQSFGYQAHVTNAQIPSASLAGLPIPPVSVPTLPTVNEPTAPSVPTYLLGSKLAVLQSGLQAKLHDLASKASTLLTRLQKKVVPVAQRVATGSARLSIRLNTLSSDAQTLSTAAADAAGALPQEAATAAGLARDLKAAQARLDAFPPAAKATAAFRTLQRAVLKLTALASAHAARLAAEAARASSFQAKAQAASSALAAQASFASGVSTQAAKAAATLAGVKIGPPKERRIHPRQVGGGALVDQAVGDLDSAITKAGATVDDDYSYLLALNKRATGDQLLTGHATGATAQYSYLVYSIAGVTHTSHRIHLASGIGLLILLIGLGFGIGFYRIRRGMPSSLKPPKSSKPATG